MLLCTAVVGVYNKWKESVEGVFYSKLILHILITFQFVVEIAM